MLNVIKAHAVNNLCYIKSQKMIPKGIVVHSTGANNPYLKRYVDLPNEVGENQNRNHWNTAKPGGRQVCVHAFIGYDKSNEIRVAEILPLNICCWGVGSGKNGSFNYNPAYIQFEICEDNLLDKVYYDKVFSVAENYCAELCKIYGIDVEKIVGHCEAYQLGYGSNHGDPEHWMKNFGESMSDFRNKVSCILKTDIIKEENEKATVLNSNSIAKGDLVAISNNATYYNGEKIPNWVKTQNWFVYNDPVGDKVIIDKNESGTNSICSPINTKYLTVVKKINNVSDKNKASMFPYLAKVVIESLNIRKDAGISHPIVCCIKDKGTYTIVEEKMGEGASKWGKLKSGIGWISLDCVKKVD